MAIIWLAPHTVSLFNPRVNPTPAPSWALAARALLLLGALSHLGGRLGQGSHLLFCLLFPTFLPGETGSVEVPGCRPGGGRAVWLGLGSARIQGLQRQHQQHAPFYRSAPLRV